MLGCLVAFVTGTNSVSAKQDNLATDQTAFQTATAQQARSSGSPVGPPAKVTLCHKGVTIEVAEPAVLERTLIRVSLRISALVNTSHGSVAQM